MAGNLSNEDYIVCYQATGTDDTTTKTGTDGSHTWWRLFGGGGLTSTDAVVAINEGSSTVTTSWVNCMAYSNDNGNFTASASNLNTIKDETGWNGCPYGTSGDYSGTCDSGAWTSSDDISDGETIARYREGASTYLLNGVKINWYEEASPTEGYANTDVPVELSKFKGSLSRLFLMPVTGKNALLGAIPPLQ
jgi:hypothetical protein